MKFSNTTAKAPRARSSSEVEIAPRRQERQGEKSTGHKEHKMERARISYFEHLQRDMGFQPMRSHVRSWESRISSTFMQHARAGSPCHDDWIQPYVTRASRPCLTTQSTGETPVRRERQSPNKNISLPSLAVLRVLASWRDSSIAKKHPRDMGFQPMRSHARSRTASLSRKSPSRSLLAIASSRLSLLRGASQ